jgi:hypothetical protein
VGFAKAKRIPHEIKPLGAGQMLFSEAAVQANTGGGVRHVELAANG